jgi:hypothetical protein
MLKIDVRHNLAAVKAQFDTLRKDQVPYATALALTRTAQAVKVGEVAEMARVFDRPTPYTLNSLYMKPATKRQLEARVWLKEDTFKGTPATKYLLPQIEGGGRRMKRFELALQRVGAMPADYQAVPGERMPMDAYGNMERGEIVRILSYLKAFGEQGYRANITDKRRTRLAKGTKTAYGYAYFVVLPGSKAKHLHPGIWKRVHTGFGSAILPMIMFVRKARYGKRFNFYQVAERVIAREFPRQFAEAARQAMATAR